MSHDVTMVGTVQSWINGYVLKNIRTDSTLHLSFVINEDFGGALEST
jgi:hypothetical protein